jgi:predicted Zn-dependent protease
VLLWNYGFIFYLKYSNYRLKSMMIKIISPILYASRMKSWDFIKAKSADRMTVWGHFERIRKLKSSFGFGISLLIMLMLTFPAHATIEYKKNTVIVDDEIEEILTDWISQIFKVAGLKGHQPKIYLIVNPEINASASIGGVIVIHTGLISRCENAAQFLGVLAHEVGHIAGGHVSRLDQAYKEALIPASAAVILGGALAAVTGNPTLLAAGLMGSSHGFERSMLKFSRTQETSADHAAMEYLNRLGWGVTGMRDFFRVLGEKTAYYASTMSPYALSHPLTSERIGCVEHYASSHSDQNPPEAIEKSFQRLKGKIVGFFEPSKAVLNNPARWKLSEEGKKYAKSIALYRMGRYAEALTELDHLIKTASGNPWYDEMKGEILFDTGKMTESIDTLKKAVQKRPQAKYLKIILAHALLESKASGAAEEARSLLIPITQKDPENTFAWKLLAQAHGKGNNYGDARLAMAEEALQKGDVRFAVAQAKQAIKGLPPGSISAQRAKDLLQEVMPRP